MRFRSQGSLIFSARRQLFCVGLAFDLSFRLGMSDAFQAHDKCISKLVWLVKDVDAEVEGLFQIHRFKIDPFKHTLLIAGKVTSRRRI